MGFLNLLYQDTYASGYSSGFGLDSFIAIILGVFATVALILFVIYLLVAIGQWKLFKKAGKPGWAALIPVYNTYVLCQIVGVSPWWILVTFIAGVIAGMMPMLSFITTIVSIYFGVLIAVSVARSFGKSDGYAVGIYFLGFIFYLILGFGDSKYLGPKPMHDIIFKNDSTNNASQFNTGNSNNSNATANNSNGGTRFCTNCGSQIAADTKFCPHCGKEL